MQLKVAATQLGAIQYISTSLCTCCADLKRNRGEFSVKLNTDGVLAVIRKKI